MHDLAPVGRMSSVEALTLGGDWAAPRSVHVDSLGFLDRMPQLRDIELHTLIVDDADYSPLLRLPNLERAFVMKSRGMRPDFEELKAALPWAC